MAQPHCWKSILSISLFLWDLGLNQPSGAVLFLWQRTQGLWWVSKRPWNTSSWIVKCGTVTVLVNHLSRSLCNEKPHVEEKEKKKLLYIFVAVGCIWLKPSSSRCFSSRVWLFYTPSHVNDSYCLSSKEVKHSLRKGITDYLLLS